MSEEIINIIPEEPKLSPYQAFQKVEREAVANEAKALKEALEGEADEAAVARRKIEQSLPGRQNDAMGFVMKGMEASIAKEDAQRAKNIQEAEQRGSDVLERFTGKYLRASNNPEDKRSQCHSCIVRQGKGEKYSLTNFNTTGDRCRDCNSVLWFFQEEMSV